MFILNVCFNQGWSKEVSVWNHTLIILISGYRLLHHTMKKIKHKLWFSGEDMNWFSILEYLFNGSSFRSNFFWYRLFFYICFWFYLFFFFFFFFVFCSSFQHVFKHYLTISPIVLIPVLRPCFPTSEKFCFNSGSTVYFKPEKNSPILVLLYTTKFEYTKNTSVLVSWRWWIDHGFLLPEE